MVKEMTGQELDALVGEGGKVVCDFFATWCGPCRMLAPVMETMSGEFQDVTFAKVNVDENGDLAASLGIISIPAVFVFDGGKVKTQSIGYLPEDDMRLFLKQNI